MEKNQQEAANISNERTVKKVAIYMRVSTQKQEDEQTIENQRMELLAKVHEDGYDVTLDCEYKDEGWSGTILERPEMDRLRADAADGKFDTLYFYDRGRIARKFLYQELILDELRKHEIELIGLHDVNGDSNEDILFGQVIGVFHEYERVKIAERMRIGKYRKVRENKMLLGYNPKYGYDYLHRIKSGDNARHAKFIVNEEQAKVVRMIFEWAASGMSKYAIQKSLFDEHIMPPKAKTNKWSTSVIDRLLRDTTYIGMHYYNKSESVETKNPRDPNQKYRKIKKGSRKKRDEKDWMMVKVDAIVTPEIFYKAQEQLKKNVKFRSNNKKNNYLLGGLIECPCGFSRTGEKANKCLYYRCNDRLNNKVARQCTLPGVNAIVLDDLVWRNLSELLLHPEILFEQARRWQKTSSPLARRRITIEERIEKLREKESRVTRMYTEGVMREELYKENVSELSKLHEMYLDEIQTIDSELSIKPSLPLEELVEGVIKLVEELDFSDKRTIVQKLVTKVVATKEEVAVWGLIPVLGTQQVGLNGKYWYRRPAKRRQINPF